MLYYILSDIHLGSRFCLNDLFVSFIRNLPNEAALILNGDIIDDPESSLPDEHGKTLNLLRTESKRRRLIWVRGNHDDDYHLEQPDKIEFVRSFSIDKRLYVSHGFDFDNIMPKNRYFIILFRALHRLRVKMGAHPVHVAQYAKKWHILYSALRRHVASNAIEYAKENNFSAVTCGHTHYAEDIIIDKVRYVNTGAWTEKPVYYLKIDDTEMKLIEYNADDS